MKPLLRIINLSKRFGALPALRQINLEVFSGEVVGLAGRSGAGKSVLAMLIAGLEAPTEGEIYFNGQRLQWPFQSRALGIEVIHQEPALANNLDITDNIFLGNEINRSLFGNVLKIPNQLSMDDRAGQILAQLGLQFPSLREKVANLSSEQRQLVAIARAIAHPTPLIVIDEPTVLLNYGNQQKLLSLIQSWHQAGRAIMFSSNNLDHLFAVTDRIVVLRQGYSVANLLTDEATREDIVSILLGTTDRTQLTPAIWALDNYYRAREQAEKMHHEQTLLERDLEAQGTLNRQLFNQLEQQVKALDEANLALQAAQLRLLTEREQERKHLARELHDQVIQDLLSANYRLEEIGGHNQTDKSIQSQLLEIQEDIRELVDDLRRICAGLRPPTIDSFGLGAAVQSYTRDWSERTGIGANLSIDPKLGRLPEAIELSVFRIIQEALSNVRKHAGASQVSINLKHATPRMMRLTVADNGQGLTEAFSLADLSAEGHYGLLGISERLALLGGRFDLSNKKEGGVLLQAEIPHPRVEKP